VENIVITGAGSGIGRALAAGFAADAVRVVGLGRTAASLEETKSLCPPGVFSYRICDVSDERAVQEAFGHAAQDVGPVQALVCNAAIYPRTYFLDQTAEDWTRALMINVVGVANCCRQVLPGMLERNKGRIVILGSLADRGPIPGASAYSASKGALHVLAAGLAAEIDPRRFPDVLINELMPGAVRTSMSPQGHDPSEVYVWAKRLTDLPAGGPTGRMFNRDREIRPNDSCKARLIHAVRRRLRGG
jgi:NAD(P)-dependent dehydrogenase (short-subunit alcohol dehydrogenase family)